MDIIQERSLVTLTYSMVNHIAKILRQGSLAETM